MLLALCASEHPWLQKNFAKETQRTRRRILFMWFSAPPKIYRKHGGGDAYGKPGGQHALEVAGVGSARVFINLSVII
jgi:hypothetical protein